MKTKVIRVALLALLGTSITSQAALVDRGNGLIFDTDKDITWLADANYSKTSGYHTTGVMNWYAADTWASNLDYQTYSDWRLPTASEMSHLFYQELGGSWGTSLASSHNTYYSLFSNIQNSSYWTSDVNPSNSDQASTFSFAGAYQNINNKIDGDFAMAVRPGDIASAVPEPESYAMLMAGLGLIGLIMRRRTQK
ncbi:MAG: hypothetical protein BGO99_05365 [Nitrosospira sp. 56-18]|jgi:hypothetical protein|nr:DUF1566 domain-containing protein [Nitrosospira sp.]OJY10714.1 MAG: hypothetical protein BGO99_05365 [Nitrosospira sp. 56-18]